MVSCMPGTHTCHTWHKELPTYTHIIYTCTAWGVNFYHQAPIGIMYLYIKVCFRAWTVVLDLHLDSLWGATPCTCAPQVSAAAVQIHELCVGICVCRVYAEPYKTCIGAHAHSVTHTSRDEVPTALLISVMATIEGLKTNGFQPEMTSICGTALDSIQTCIQYLY